MPLSEIGQMIFGALKDKGVLVHTSEHGLSLTPSSVMVMKFCGDGKKSADKVEHQKSLCEHVGIPDIHYLATNGGALWIGAHPKMREKFPRHFSGPYPKSDMDADEIVDSCAPDVQDTDIVGIYAHGPCVIARRAGMNVYEVIWSIVEARKRVLERNPSLHVVPYYHVENGEKRTYVVDVDAWDLCEPELRAMVDRFGHRRTAAEASA